MERDDDKTWRDRLTERVLKRGYRVASSVIWGRGDYAEWAYERLQRPASALGLAANMACYALRQPAAPAVVSLAIEPVYGCNLRCQTCWGRYEREMTGLRPPRMPWEIFAKAIDQAPSSVESVNFAMAGEPLLDPRLPDMISYVVQSGRRATVVTNGTLLDGPVGEALAASPLAVLSLSVETDPEMARRIRGVDHEQLIRNLRLFVSRKRPETLVRLSVAVHPENEGRLDRLAGDFAGLIDGIKVSPYVYFLDEREGSGRARCLEPWRGNLCVLTSGDVTPCCFDLGAHLSFGVLGERSFAEILAGPQRREILAAFASGRAPSRCGRCRQFVSRNLPRRIAE